MISGVKKINRFIAICIGIGLTHSTHAAANASGTLHEPEIGETPIAGATLNVATQQSEADAPNLENRSGEPQVLTYDAVQMQPEDSAKFPVPEPCQAHADTIECPQGDLKVQVVVVDSGGSLVSHETVITDKAIVVDDVAEAETYAVAFASTSTSELEVATSTFAEFMSDREFLSDEEIQSNEQELTAALSDQVTFSAASFARGAIKRPSFVSVPGSYRYCPSSCSPKTLHDYCSYSPDSATFSYPGSSPGGTIRKTVSFRGPCARHDMAIDSIRKQSISLSSKRAKRRSSDSTFKSHIRQNCGYYMYRSVDTNGRVSCYSRAATYYAAVSSRTKTWNGK